ncbi:unnamed protein product [Ectocarpus sp. 12 AP-2014]
MTSTQQSKSGGGQRRAHGMMRSMPLDDEMIRLKRKAQEREEKLGNQASGRLAGPPNGDTEDAGASVNEHADTWGFSWMPAIEDFVEQAAEAQQRNEDDSEESSPLGANYRSDTDDEEASLRGPPTNTTIRSSFCDPTSPSSGAARSSGGLSPSGSSLQRGGRKRRRPQAGGVTTLSSSSSSSSRRRAPRPPSYNETLLADKSFHNPHASETMADAFGILRPASFVLDVEADDRPWGGAAGVTATGAKGATAEGREADAIAGNSGGENQNWFYDTVRDRQNRLWADTRVRKGVELARKGQHQAAIDTYTQALGMCPDHDDGLVARGAAFASTGRLRQAVQDLSRALTVNPQNGNASSYLTETRSRRMERQEARETPGASATIGNTTTFENRTDSSVNGRRRLNGVSAAGGAVMPASMMASAGSTERDEASKAALGALLHDGAEGDALRKMRALLEEDEKKRKRRGARGESRGGGDGDGEEGSRKKKSRKKDKKSSSKSKRSSSGRHRKRDRRESGGGGGSRHDSSSTSSSSGNSSAEDTDARSSSSKKKKKKKRHLKRKKRSSTKTITTAAVGFRNGGSRGLGTGVSMSVSAEGGEDSEGDEAHPILQRKKHSLWG